VCNVESEDGLTAPLEKILAAIDSETRLVSVSHVLFRSSAVQDLKAITDRAHEAGAYIMVDLYQSVGTVPLNVCEIGVDFATGGSVKWLCGGPGAGYLYVRRDLWPALEPRVTGWAAHRESFAFDTGPMEYAEDALRFTTGTPNVPGMYAAKSGYEIIHEVGVEKIRAKSLRQTELLMGLADAAGFPVRSPRALDQRGGTVTIDVLNGKAVTAELARREILVDSRPGAGIRLAPHFYSKDEELELVIREIEKIS
jgi:kynureninase